MPRLAGPPLAVLASAYDVPPDLSAVSAAVYERLFGATEIAISIDSLGDIPAAWTAIGTLIGMLIVNTQDFARIRGGGRPTKALRKGMAEIAGVHVSSADAEGFVDRVISEIASTLEEHH